VRARSFCMRISPAEHRSNEPSVAPSRSRTALIYYAAPVCPLATPPVRRFRDLPSLWRSEHSRSRSRRLGTTRCRSKAPEITSRP